MSLAFVPTREKSHSPATGFLAGGWSKREASEAGEIEQLRDGVSLMR